MAGAGTPTKHRGRERSQNFCESRTNTELVRPSVQGIVQATSLFAGSVLYDLGARACCLGLFFNYSLAERGDGRRDSVL